MLKPSPYTLGSLQSEYLRLFDSCRVEPKRKEEVEHAITTILRGGTLYSVVEMETGVPWYFVGIIHALEASSSFTKHLHNGDPLSARTVNVPKGRPLDGEPPFTWPTSAIDALKLQRLDKWNNWTIGGLLFRFEAYNGFGYRKRGIFSPYLWACSNHYTAGKFVADGKWSPGAVSKQVGGAVILKRMIEQGLCTVQEAANVATA